MTLVDVWRLFVACLLALLYLYVAAGVYPESVRIRQALERAWPSNQQIDAGMPR